MRTGWIYSGLCSPEYIQDTEYLGYILRLIIRLTPAGFALLPTLRSGGAKLQLFTNNHIPFYPQLLSQRPRRGIAALRAGACTASTIHCLIPRENCISNFHCPQRGRPSLNIVLSLKPTFNIVQTLRGIRCNYPLPTNHCHEAEAPVPL